MIQQPRHEPIVVAVSISTPAGDFTFSKTQPFDARGRPLQSLSGLWKDLLADVTPIIRRHDTVVVV